MPPRYVPRKIKKRLRGAQGGFTFGQAPAPWDWRLIAPPAPPDLPVEPGGDATALGTASAQGLAGLADIMSNPEIHEPRLTGPTAFAESFEQPYFGEGGGEPPISSLAGLDQADTWYVQQVERTSQEAIDKANAAWDSFEDSLAERLHDRGFVRSPEGQWTTGDPNITKEVFEADIDSFTKEFLTDRILPIANEMWDLQEQADAIASLNKGEQRAERLEGAYWARQAEVDRLRRELERQPERRRQIGPGGINIPSFDLPVLTDFLLGENRRGRDPGVMAMDLLGAPATGVREAGRFALGRERYDALPTAVKHGLESIPYFLLPPARGARLAGQLIGGPVGLGAGGETSERLVGSRFVGELLGGAGPFLSNARIGATAAEEFLSGAVPVPAVLAGRAARGTAGLARDLPGWYLDRAAASGQDLAASIKAGIPQATDNFYAGLPGPLPGESLIELYARAADNLKGLDRLSLRKVAMDLGLRPIGDKDQLLATIQTHLDEARLNGWDLRETRPLRQGAGPSTPVWTSPRTAEETAALLEEQAKIAISDVRVVSPKIRFEKETAVGGGFTRAQLVSQRDLGHVAETAEFVASEEALAATVRAEELKKGLTGLERSRARFEKQAAEAQKAVDEVAPTAGTPPANVQTQLSKLLNRDRAKASGTAIDKALARIPDVDDIDGIEDVKDALSDLQGLTRGDFEDAEEYRDAVAEAFDALREAIESLEDVDTIATAAIAKRNSVQKKLDDVRAVIAERKAELTDVVNGPTGDWTPQNLEDNFDLKTIRRVIAKNYTPEAGAAQRKLEADIARLSPEELDDFIQRIDDEQAVQSAAHRRSLRTAQRFAARMEDLAGAFRRGEMPEGTIRAGNLQNASRLYADYKAAVKAWKENPAGINKTSAAEEPANRLLASLIDQAVKEGVNLAGEPTFDAVELLRVALAGLRERMPPGELAAAGAEASSVAPRYVVQMLRPDGTPINVHIVGVGNTLLGKNIDDFLLDLRPQEIAELVANGLPIPVVVHPLTREAIGGTALGKTVETTSDKLRLHYNETRLQARMSLAEDLADGGFRTLPAPDETHIRTVSRAELDNDVRQTWAKLEAVFEPTVPTSRWAETSPERLENFTRGLGEFMTTTGPKNKKQVAEWNETAIRLAKGQIERFRQAKLVGKDDVGISDPDIKAWLGSMDIEEPRRLFFETILGRSRGSGAYDPPPVVSGGIRGFAADVAHGLTGRIVSDSRVLGLVSWRESARNAAQRFLQITMEGNYRKALEQIAEDGGFMVRSAYTEPRLREGDALQRMLRANFNIEGSDPALLPLQRTRARLIEAGRADAWRELEDILSSNWGLAYRYPAMFPNLPLPARKVLAFAQESVGFMEDMAVFEGAKPVAQRLSNRMSLNHQTLSAAEWGPARLLDSVRGRGAEVRDILPRVANGRPVLDGSFPEMVEWLASYMVEHNIRTPLHEILVQGESAAVVYPSALLESVITERVRRGIRALAKDPEKTPLTAITNEGNHWAISGGLSPWPTELHKDIQQTLRLFEGKFPFEEFRKFSQSVATGVLAADLNMVSLQGPIFLATTVVPSLLHNPKNTFKMLRELTTALSDTGFTTLAKTKMDDWQYWSEIDPAFGRGIAAFFGGALDDTKVPLEMVPFLGNAVTFVNDVQFNRALILMKDWAIREHLFTVQSMRASKLPGPLKWFGQLPGMPKDESVMQQFMYGAEEDVIKGVIRQVHNSLGGINMTAQGISPMRQSVEQILTIVPGFLRAQTGIVEALLAKPFTVEGMLAYTLIGREIAFYAGVAYLMSTVAGHADRFNFDHPERSDWLAVQLDNEYVPTFPRPGLLRLFARTTDAIAQQVTGEGDRSPEYALRSFLAGRFSPAAGAVYNAFRGKDFLGRNYDDLQQQAIATVAQFLPIAMQNIIENIQEQSRANNPHPGNLKDTAINAIGEFLGKSRIPRHPLDKLDELVKNHKFPNPLSEAEHNDLFPGVPYKAERTYERWNDLADYDKTRLRDALPVEVATAEAELDFWQSRRDTPKEVRISALFERGRQTSVDTIQQPQRILGRESTQWQDDASLDRGTIDGQDWVRRYQERQRIIQQEWGTITDLLDQEGLDLNAIGAERLARLEKAYDPEDFAFLVEKAQAEILGIEMPFTTVRLEGPTGITEEFSRADFDAFFAKREETLGKYPKQVRDQLEVLSREGETSGTIRYQQANELRKTLDAMPRYAGNVGGKGISLADANLIEAMLDAVDDISGVGRAAIGQPGISIPHLRDAAWQIIADTIGTPATQHGVPVERAQQLWLVAKAINEDPQFAERMRNKAAAQYVIDHPDVALFYPYTLSRVPVALRNQLPETMRPRYDLWQGYRILQERNPKK